MILFKSERFRIHNQIIMQRSPSLLVCLSPSVPPSQVNELVFHHLVDQIVPVKNVRMIAYEGQMKAFVQVEDQESAEAVILALNGRLMNVGKVKVFVSNKNYVNYDQPLHQVLERCMSKENAGSETGQRSTLSTLHGFNPQSALQIESRIENAILFSQKVSIDVSNGHAHEHKNMQSRKLNAIEMHDFLDSSALSQQNGSQPSNIPINPLHAVRVTHSDGEAMIKNRVLRVFRRFGRVINMTLDSDINCWTVEYRSVKDAEKAIIAIDDDKLFGYRMYVSTNSEVNADKLARINSDTTIRRTDNKKQCAVAQENKPTVNSCEALRIIFNNPLLSVSAAVRLVSITHCPNKLTRYFNYKTNQCYYVVEYDYSYQAAEAFISLNNLSHEFESCKAKFEHSTG